MVNVRRRLVQIIDVTARVVQRVQDECRRVDVLQIVDGVLSFEVLRGVGVASEGGAGV